MNITKENTGDYTASITIDLTPEDYSKKVNDKLNDIRKKVNIPGFRIGKAPIGLIKRQYLESVILEEIGHISYESVNKYIDENKINIIGSPTISKNKAPIINEITENSNFTFVFDIGIVPEYAVNLEDLKDVNYYKIGVDDKTVQSEVERIKKQFSSIDMADIVTEKSLLVGDLIITDNSKEENDKTKINKQHKYFLIEKLENNEKLKQKLLNLKANDSIEIIAEDIENKEVLNFLLPENIDFSDKNLNLSFSIAQIYEIKLPELESEFFEKIMPSKEIKNEADFLNKVKAHLEVEIEKQAGFIFLDEVRNSLIKNVDLPLPKEHIKNILAQSMKEHNEQQHLLDLENNFEQHYNQVKWEYILKKIMEENNISHFTNLDSIKEFLLENYYSSNYHLSLTEQQIEQEVENIVKDKKRLEELEENYIKHQLIELFKNKVKFTKTYFDSVEDFKNSVKK